MKSQLYKIIFILSLLPINLFAQPASTQDMDITGLWKGLLYNDTTGKYLPYEIAISEEKGIFSGYSYTIFDIDGKKELGVKRIKIKRKDDQLIIEDVVLISNTYTAPPPRKVRQQSVLSLLVKDTTMLLTGKWSTNRTKEYLPLTGSIQLQRETNYRSLALFKKLEELNLDKNLSFVMAAKEKEAGIALKEMPKAEIKSTVPLPLQPVVVNKPKENPAIEKEKKAAIAVENTPATIDVEPLEKLAVKTAIYLPVAISVSLSPQKTSWTITSNEFTKKRNKGLEQAIVNAPVVVKPAIMIFPVADKNSTDFVKNTTAAIKTKPSNELVKKTKDKPKTIIALPVTKKREPIATVKAPIKKENLPSPVVVKKPAVNDGAALTVNAPASNTITPVIEIKETVKTKNQAIATTITTAVSKKELPVEVAASKAPAAAANVSERKMNYQQSVFFDSDSLVLTLYDNGEVDGDTVSILMNGKIIFANQGLTTKANSKTIYIDKGMPDSLLMVMYAENLGSIPPNTGLMIIMDGEKRYEVRFSSDFKTNAAILLKRRKKETK